MIQKPWNIANINPNFFCLYVIPNNPSFIIVPKERKKTRQNLEKGTMILRVIMLELPHEDKFILPHACTPLLVEEKHHDVCATQPTVDVWPQAPIASTPAFVLPPISTLCCLHFTLMGAQASVDILHLDQSRKFAHHQARKCHVHYIHLEVVLAKSSQGCLAIY